MDIKELIKDEAFAESVVRAETPEAIAELFADKGVEVSAEEIRKIMESAEPDNDDEISTADLEDVAGGSAATTGIALGMIKLPCLICGRWVSIYGYSTHVASHRKKPW